MMKAEWERQYAVQLTWPHEGTDWAPILEGITATYLDMTAAIIAHERLIIVGPSADSARDLIRERVGEEKARLVSTLTCDTDDTWARDHGLISVSEDDGIRLLDFRFNGWGRKYPAEKDNDINRHLHAAGLLHGTYEWHGDFVLEGGSIESDGKGTLFTTTSCLTAKNRNGMDKATLESELKRRLRAERIVWIEHGTITGDDTDGHIDTLMRIAPDNTIVYVGCDDRNDEQYGGLAAMEEQIRTLRTTDGKPYRLLRLPLPEAIYEGEERLPATYANYLVINGAVLCPTYGQPASDALAMTIISKAYPDRKIVGIDSRPIIRQRGSVHCCAMQYY